ncbi:methyltransferase domain-containing protein [Streptomyces sp. NPDC094468]|uniref:methyltransferase domain-containing protein n=1 Tax=Streptomyces sp. NPDC094468 TaxID=3366066 RepID=UPI0037F52BC9
MGSPDLSEERSALGRSLLARGAMAPDWRAAFEAVPRSAFLPEVIWPYDMESGTHVTVDLRDEPGLWFQYADADVPVVTQWDDGKPAGDGARVPTSSASMPSVVFGMLADLDVEPGRTVLEIGTGTGWNAALLSHRLGLDHVTTVEIDAKVADTARDNLAAQNLLGTVLTRDGALGDPAGAPYDRIIATAGLRRIPTAWLEQLRPEGLIVAPWGTDYSNGDAIVRLARSEHGVEGRFTRPAEFMKLRAQRRSFAGHSAYVPDEGLAGADRSTTKVTEADLLGADRFDPRTFAIGLHVSSCYQVLATRRGADRPVWFYGLDDRSWACVMFHENRQAEVWQSGPRRLWTEVESALSWWRDVGEPGYDRFGLTVTWDGEHRAWLDSPEKCWPVM